MSEHHRHRHKQRTNRFLRFVRTCRFEIIWVAVIGLGLFLLLERMSIRSALGGWLARAGAAILDRIGHFSEQIAALVTRITLSDAIGLVLIVGAGLTFALRMRWRLMHDRVFTDLRCPRCDGEIHRAHRHLFDRLINLFVPVRRYFCANRNCRWHGLRVTTSDHRPRPRAVVE